MFGFIPNNIELYKLALIHKSASIVLDNGQHINNERLEFLGDAIIESVSSDYLFIEFPDKNEGFLTQMRSKMVSRQSLNGVAKRIGLDEYVITNSSNSSAQKHIFGDAFEAMMGAIYLDQGYDFVNRLLINNIFSRYLKLDSLAESETDFKSRLIEWCQKNHHTIHFHTIHDKTYSTSHPFFYAKVLIDNIEVGYGAGESKKEAEQRAAYSVSQGFNDADCTKLLDRLDNIDAQERVAQQRSRKQESKAEPKVVENTPAETKPAENKASKETAITPIVTMEEKPTKSDKPEEVKSSMEPKATKSTKPKKTANAEAAKEAAKEVAKETTTQNNIVEEVTEPEATEKQEENTQQESKPKNSRRRSTRNSKSKKSANTTAENIEAESTIENNEAAQEVEPTKASENEQQSAPKPKARRRRTAKSKETQSKVAAAQTEIIDSSSIIADSIAHPADNQ
jgi:ribonuclease-3